MKGVCLLVLLLVYSDDRLLEGVGSWGIWQAYI